MCYIEGMLCIAKVKYIHKLFVQSQYVVFEHINMVWCRDSIQFYPVKNKLNSTLKITYIPLVD